MKRKALAVLASLLLLLLAACSDSPGGDSNGTTGGNNGAGNRATVLHPFSLGVQTGDGDVQFFSIEDLDKVFGDNWSAILQNGEPVQLSETLGFALFDSRNVLPNGTSANWQTVFNSGMISFKLVSVQQSGLLRYPWYDNDDLAGYVHAPQGYNRFGAVVNADGSISPLPAGGFELGDIFRVINGDLQAQAWVVVCDQIISEIDHVIVRYQNNAGEIENRIDPDVLNAKWIEIIPDLLGGATSFKIEAHMKNGNVQSARTWILRDLGCEHVSPIEEKFVIEIEGGGEIIPPDPDPDPVEPTVEIKITDSNRDFPSYGEPDGFFTESTVRAAVTHENAYTVTYQLNGLPVDSAFNQGNDGVYYSNPLGSVIEGTNTFTVEYYDQEGNWHEAEKTFVRTTPSQILTLRIRDAISFVNGGAADAVVDTTNGIVSVKRDGERWEVQLKWKLPSIAGWNPAGVEAGCFYRLEVDIASMSSVDGTPLEVSFLLKNGEAPYTPDYADESRLCDGPMTIDLVPDQTATNGALVFFLGKKAGVFTFGNTLVLKKVMMPE